MGALALAFVVFNAASILLHRDPTDLLWACHVACALVALGQLFGWPAPNAIGVLWLSIGVPLWLLDLAGGGQLHPTSVLTHLGGLALGVAGIRVLGLPRHSWAKAILSLGTLGLFCRIGTPARANVNLVHAIHPGWESLFPSYPVYALCLFSLCGLAFLATERLIGLLAATRLREVS
jgi:hypothetical protein